MTLPPPSDDDLPPEERTIAYVRRPSGPMTNPGMQSPANQVPDATQPAPDSGVGPRSRGASSAAASPALPQIPGITLLGEIARGGMGVVYSGRQDFLDRRVAVKFLSVDLRSEQFAARFRREAKILAGVKHPNIVSCYAAGTTEAGQSYLVMELVEGPNLKNWIGQNGPLAVAAALRMTRALASALANAHEQGVIHRDVKSENILLETASSTQIDLTFPFVPKLVDLGLARMTREGMDLGLTSPGSVMGTPSTMSPEQFDDPDHVDFRTDIYGLGCVLHEMLTGRPAFSAANLGDLVVAKRRPSGPDPSRDNSSIPASVGAFVSSLLAADRAQRPANYAVLLEQIDGLLAQHGHATAAPARKSSSTVAAPTAPKQPTGPDLLRTAEFEFLAAGNAPPAEAPAFRESTPHQAAVPARSSRWPWLLGATVLAAAGAGAFWYANQRPMNPPDTVRNQDAAKLAETSPRPLAVTPNLPPTVAALTGPVRFGLGKPVTFRVEANDPEGSGLTYRWSSPQSRLVVFAPADRAETEVRILDGLPTEEFLIEAAVSDGQNEPVVVRQKVIVDEYKPKRLLNGFRADDSIWQLDDAVFWVQNGEDGSVSCNAEEAARISSCGLGDDAYWHVVGWLESARMNTPQFAETGLRLEFGDLGYSLLCTRSGPGGLRWAIEMHETQRIDGRWQLRPPVGEPRRVEWDDAEDDPMFAFVSLKRRRDEVTIQFGNPKKAKLLSHTFVLTEGAYAAHAKSEPRLAIFASGGRGRFHDFSIF